MVAGELFTIDNFKVYCCFKGDSPTSANQRRLSWDRGRWRWRHHADFARHGSELVTRHFQSGMTFSRPFSVSRF